MRESCIYHFKDQEVKNPTLQTVYDLELKWGRYGLLKTTGSSWVRISHQPMQVRISHQPMRLWCEISSVLATPHEIFSFVFFTLSEIFLSRRNTEFSLLSFSLFYFLFLGSQTTSEDVFPEDERLNLCFLGVKEARWKVQMQKWKTLVP